MASESSRLIFAKEKPAIASLKAAGFRGTAAAGLAAAYPGMPAAITPAPLVLMKLRRENFMSDNY
jgi:phosphoribosylcarboxyaminoimidazole (NCAIR) mutase